MLTLADVLNIVSDDIGANRDPVQRLNLVFAAYLDEIDVVGSLELVKITVTADANGEGFITLPDRYRAIRGAVETTVANSFSSGRPLEIRNKWYEYAPGNLGMLKGSDPMRGIIPITKSQGDTLQKYKVPIVPTPGSNTYFTCICKLEFKFLENNSDVVPIQNIYAIRKGLKALDKADAEDFVREEQLWEQGKKKLAAQIDNETGSEALGKVQIEDDFQLGCLGFEDGGWGYGYGGW